MASPLRVVAVEDLVALAPHAAAWDALAAEVPEPVPMRTHAWFATHVETKLAAEGRWRCFLAYEDARLVGVLALVRAEHRVLGMSRPRWRVPGEYFTHDADAVLAIGHETPALAALTEAAAAAEPRRFSVDLGGIRDGSTTLAALRAGAARGAVHLEPEAEGARILVRGTFHDWFHGIGENMRINLRKAGNRLEKQFPGALAYRFLAGRDATEAPLAVFAAIEDAGWKGEQGGALARSPVKMEIYRRLAKRFSERGMLEWHFFDVGGKPAAAHMAVRMGRALVMFRICYDEGLSKFMPGNLLIREAVERAFTAGDTDAIDFVQTQPWQKNWRMETYAYHRARIFARRPLPFLFGALPARARAAARRIPLLRRIARALGGDASG